MLLIGPPGSGKLIPAARLPALLPPLDPAEALDVSMIHSVAGLLDEGRMLRQRPFRAPHHTASALALVGGGASAKRGELRLAYLGVLFLDALPEWSGQREKLERHQPSSPALPASDLGAADYCVLISRRAHCHPIASLR